MDAPGEGAGRNNHPTLTHGDMMLKPFPELQQLKAAIKEFRLELLAEKRNLLEAFRAGCKAAHGTADEILLKGLENALAYSKLQRRPAIDMKNSLTVDKLPKAWNAQTDLANSWDNLKNENEIKRWLLNEYPISPDWMAYPDIPGEEFKGYHLDSVPHIILQALARFGSSNPLPADCIDPEHIGADRELLRDADLVLSTAASMLELAAPIPQPIPVTERLPGPEDCCGNPRNGQGQWCWGRVRPRTTAGTPVVWRLMRIDCLIEEAEDWLPWWAIPLPAADAGEVQP